MSDGRFITSYVDNDVLVQFIRHVNEIKSSQDFKNFMVSNANEIMDKERKFIESKYTCSVDGQCGNESKEGFDNTDKPAGFINVMNYPDNSNKSRFGNLN